MPGWRLPRPLPLLIDKEDRVINLNIKLEPLCRVNRLDHTIRTTRPPNHNHRHQSLNLKHRVVLGVLYRIRRTNLQAPAFTLPWARLASRAA